MGFWKKIRVGLAVIARFLAWRNMYAPALEAALENHEDAMVRVGWNEMKAIIKLAETVDD